MSGHARFWDRIAEKYAKSPVADEASYKKKLEITREYFSPSMQVLEFGCGTGTTAIAHAPYVSHIRATDISSAMLDIARERASAAKVTNVEFEQADIDTLEVPGESYDAVMGHSILHLVADRDATIAKVHEMLKPGGVFISSTACLGDSVFRYIRYIVPLGRLSGLLPLVKVFTRAELLESLKRAGFTIEHEWCPDAKKAVFIVARKAG